MSVTFNDYSDEVLQAFDEACLRALERCGLQAEGYAKDLVPVDTIVANDFRNPPQYLIAFLLKYFS